MTVILTAALTACLGVSFILAGYAVLLRRGNRDWEVLRDEIGRAHV